MAHHMEVIESSLGCPACGMHSRGVLPTLPMRCSPQSNEAAMAAQECLEWHSIPGLGAC